MLQVLSGFKWHRCGVRLYTAHVRALSWEFSGRITASRHMELRSCSEILKWWLTVFSSAGLNSAHSLSKNIRERCRTSINGSIRTAYITGACVFELATYLSVSISVAEVYLSWHLQSHVQHVRVLCYGASTIHASLGRPRRMPECRVLSSKLASVNTCGYVRADTSLTVTDWIRRPVRKCHIHRKYNPAYLNELNNSIQCFYWWRYILCVNPEWCFPGITWSIVWRLNIFQHCGSLLTPHLPLPFLLSEKKVISCVFAAIHSSRCSSVGRILITPQYYSVKVRNVLRI